jgi:hypothetical protein
MPATCFVCNETLNLESCVVDELGNVTHADCYLLQLKRVKPVRENLVKEALRRWLSTQQKSKAS